MALFDTPLYSSDQSIDRVLKAGLPVVLVFLNGATPPALDQALKALAKREAGKLLVVQLDMKDSPQTAGQYKVQAAPALVTIKDGQIYSQTGSIGAADVEAHARYLLGRGPRPEPAAAQRTPANAYAGASPGAAGGSTASPNGASPNTSYSTGDDGQSGHPVTVTDATFEQEVLRSPIPMVAGRFGVSGIPTMLVVRGGKTVDQWAGALPEQALRSRLSNSLR